MSASSVVEAVDVFEERPCYHALVGDALALLQPFAEAAADCGRQPVPGSRSQEFAETPVKDFVACLRDGGPGTGSCNLCQSHFLLPTSFVLSLKPVVSV